MGERIEKVSIIVSKGSLEGVYPGLIMANGARAEGIDANLFFTFFGLDAIHKQRLEHLKVAAVGNPGMHMASLIGVLPGMSAIATHMMEKKMEEHDIPGRTPTRLAMCIPGLPTAATLMCSSRFEWMASSPKNVKNRLASIPSARAPLAMISPG